MLRRPSDWLAVRLGEGCSSTAFGLKGGRQDQVWANPADRGP